MENNAKVGELRDLADRATARAHTAIITGNRNARRMQIKAADLRAAADTADTPLALIGAAAEDIEAARADVDARYWDAIRRRR